MVRMTGGSGRERITRVLLCGCFPKGRGLVRSDSCVCVEGHTHMNLGWEPGW